MVGNVYAAPSRLSPNGPQLKDGAVQRASVQVDRNDLHYKTNTDKVGVYKREELNIRASAGAESLTPWDGQNHRYRIARIYMPQVKHCHNHPSNKTIGNYWAIDFASQGVFKSPLMGWSRGNMDVLTTCPQNMNPITFPSVNDAISYAEHMGWGYDVSYPKYKWHSSKNYADNFKWKGDAKPEQSYD